jgi:hypothetical protein
MKFIEQYKELKDVFDLDKEIIALPDSHIRIRNYNFKSVFDIPSDLAIYDEDCCISENNRFRYPVFVPRGNERSSKALIYLHGLNERTWYKHLAGAKLMAEKTNIPVVMFPLSFHINRGLPEWSDSRKMADMLTLRKQRYPDVKEASIINLALSDRLTHFPQRFFVSGLQSTMDLLGLLDQIKSGEHELFEKGAEADIFAYSISCMLLQALMMSKAGEKLDRSRIVFFAGGSVFSYLQGISKFIMDSVAFDSILKFYTGLTLKNSDSSSDRKFAGFITGHDFGKAFSTIITPDFRKKEREKKMDKFINNLMVIAMRDDKVIPVDGIRHATGERFSDSGQFRIVHFPYPYSHENPFPVLYDNINLQVDASFHAVYDPAIQFFNRNLLPTGS